MMEANINYIPPKETKNVAYTVRAKDRNHNIILAAACLSGKGRAVTTVDMAVAGALMLLAEEGLTRYEEIEQMLIDRGVISAPNNRR